MSFYQGETGATTGSGTGRARGHELKTLGNGRYRVIGLAGRGGMSIVYHAYDTQNDRDVAIKVLSLDLASEETFLARFQRESELMRDLTHPNILRAYDYGQEGDNVFLVMSYYGGGTLKDRMGDGPMPLAQVVEFLDQICAGLGYAHSRNVIHRDIKPSNLLVHHASESLVISDFGIAKALSNANTIRTGTIMGTPLYMAPEQFLDRVDKRSDIYSVGIVLYQMLTGQVPFRGEGLGFQHLNDPVPPMNLFGVSYGPEIETVVKKALAKRPEVRYQRVEDLAEAFRSAVNYYSLGSTEDLKLDTIPLVEESKDFFGPEWSQQQTAALRLTEVLPGQDSLSLVPILDTDKLEDVNPPGAPTLNIAGKSYSPLTGSTTAKAAQSPAYQRPSPPTETVPPAPAVPAPTPKPAKRSRGWLVVLVAALVVGIIAIGTGLYFLLLNNPDAGKIIPSAGASGTVTSTTAASTTTVPPNTTTTVGSGPAVVPGTTSSPVVGVIARKVKVLFTAHPTGKPEETNIYVYDQTTGETAQLTDSGRDTLPVWSGDGASIFFQSYRNSSLGSIYKMSADGRAQVLMVDKAKTPTAFHSGSRIAYINTVDEQIYTAFTYQSPATGQTAVTTAATNPGVKLGLAISADDTRIAWAEKDAVGTYQIWTQNLNVAGAKPQKLTNCSNENCLWPSWSPDGTQLVFNTSSVADQEADRVPLNIRKMNADGSGQVTLVMAGTNEHNSHAIWVQDGRGPSGNRIYFNSDRQDDLARIYVMNPDGSDQQAFIPRKGSPTEDFAPSILLY